MKRWVLIGSVASALLAGGVWAGPWGGGHGGKMIGMGGPIGVGWVVNNPEKAKEFGVTDDQIAALKDIGYKARQQMIKLRADSETARLEIEHLMDADKPDEAAILKAIENAGRVEIEIQKARVQETLRVRQTLGDDQLAKIRDALREERKERRDERKAPRDESRKRGGKHCPFFGGPGGAGPEEGDMPPPGAEPPEAEPED